MVTIPDWSMASFLSSEWSTSKWNSSSLNVLPNFGRGVLIAFRYFVPTVLSTKMLWVWKFIFYTYTVHAAYSNVDGWTSWHDENPDSSPVWTLILNSEVKSSHKCVFEGSCHQIEALKSKLQRGVNLMIWNPDLDINRLFIISISRKTKTNN